MNKMIRIGGAMALLWAATGCVKDAPYYVEPVDPETTETGYLRLSDLGLYVVVDSETDQSTEASPTMSLTRVDDGDEIDGTTGVMKGHEVVVADNNLSDFKVKISAHGQETTPVFDGTYGELRSKMISGKGLEVPIGVYDITATSNTTAAGAPTGVQARPSYAGLYAGADNTGVEVKKGATSDVGTIKCKLQNIKITVTVAADLYSQLEPLSEGNMINASVSYKDNTSIFWNVPTNWAWTKKQDEQVPVYFPALSQEEKVLIFTFTAKLKGKTESITMKREIAHVTAGQWRRIHVIPKHDAQGNLTFEAEISTFVQDEKITVGDEENATVPMFWTEQPYVDPDDPSMAGPSIKWADGTDLPETITAAAQQVKIAAPNGIGQIGLTVATTNADFSADAAAMTVADLCAVASSRYLTNYGIPFGSALKGQTEVSFGLDKILGQIGGFNGEYTFAFKVTDQSGASCEQTLKFVIGGGGGGSTEGPIKIEGVGFNIDERRNIDDNGNVELADGTKSNEVKVNVQAANGITALWVTINSNELTPMLGEVGIPQKFNLCVLDETLAKKLSGLGFPCNDEVLNKTDVVEFSISSTLMGMLKAFTGDHDFVLEVESHGETATKTIKLHK